MVAGIGKMPRGKFFAYNVIGALLWGVGLTMLGYWLGGIIPGLGKYIEYAFIAVICLSIAPALWHIARDPRSRKMLARKLRQIRQ
jgi:membrane-associated protein